MSNHHLETIWFFLCSTAQKCSISALIAEFIKQCSFSEELCSLTMFLLAIFCGLRLTCLPSSSSSESRVFSATLAAAVHSLPLPTFQYKKKKRCKQCVVGIYSFFWVICTFFKSTTFRYVYKAMHTYIILTYRVNKGLSLLICVSRFLICLQPSCISFIQSIIILVVHENSLSSSRFCGSEV